MVVADPAAPANAGRPAAPGEPARDGTQRVTAEVAAQAPPDWDAFVAARPDGSAYHRAAAVAIAQRVFGLPVYYASVRDPRGALRGVLPLVEQSSLAFGRFLVSVPYFTYGGILAEDDAAAASLAAAASSLARDRGARHVELRHRAAVAGLGLPERLDKVSLELALPSTEAALAKQLGSKLRSQIRRAEREGVEVRWGREDQVDEFYAVFARSMRDLGTPVYPRRFFRAVLAALPDTEIATVRLAGVVQACAVLVRHGDRIEVPWAAATPEGKRASANMRLYWELLRRAQAAGAAAFDFGRSSVDSGTYRFKLQWGAEPRQLHWHYWLPEGAALPQLNHANPKYALAVSVWQRLPLWCANLIGPAIAGKLP
ncbi:MAG: FemAB family PEP-CTERM system-associated protein [Proteobacteria bacterium]|nr:FemAB family PEP-CTERM system-associated protein [Pseudomonadota bacterium]